MNNIKIFLSAFYESNKREFWLLVLFNIVLGLVVNFYPLNDLVQAAIIILMALKNISFLRSSSVMPSVSSDFDRYSWKYFQGLPLNKEELIICLIISNLFVMFPGLVWVMSFFVQLSGLFIDSDQAGHFDIILAVKVFLCLVPILVVVSTMSLENLITFPRRQYSKNDPRHVFFYKVKRAVLGVTGVLYALAAYFYLSELTGIEFAPYAGKVLKFVLEQSTWWLVPGLVLIAVQNSFSVLKVWQNEKKSYVKIDWQPKRDFSVIAVCLALVWVPVKVLDIFTPDEYVEGKIVNAVYKEDFKKVEALIKAGEDINTPNTYGVTPILVAALNGHEYMFNFLEKRGARMEGVGKIKGYPQHGLNVYLAAIKSGNLKLASRFLQPGSDPNEMNKENKWHAIHYAASTCKPKILDLLIEKKADLNALNADGQTALHLAAKDGCFASVVLLLDAGANPGIADNKKKVALEYAKSSGYKNRDLDFYMLKRARLPAGK